jgi:ABC-type maltose transport system permease subunit
MNEMNDEELQQWLEGKPQLPGDASLGKDAKAYHTLFEALGREPEKGLPYDFSAKVVRSVQAETKRSNDLKFNIIAAVLSIVAIAIACFALSILNPTQESTLLKFKWVLLLLPVAFIAIQYFDQKLVKEKLFHHKHNVPR